MRKGERFLRLISLVTAAAALCMLASALLRGRSTVRAHTALRVTVSESVQVTGYFIRDERLLSAPCSYAAPLAAEGEKVAAGQLLAFGTERSEALEQAAALFALRQRIRLLEQAMRTPPESCSARIRYLLQKLAAGPPAAAEDSAFLRALILRGGADEVSFARLLSDLRQQAEELESEMEGTALYAPEAGWFSACADGYEGVLTPACVSALKDPSLLPAASVPERAWGRLIRSGTWYLAAMLPEASLPEVGTGVEVCLANGTVFSMQVFRAEVESGLLVLACGSGLERISALRSASCTLTFSSRDGLQFPASALRTDEAGQTGVYVLEGASARWKPVTVLRSGQDSCIAALEQTGMDRLRSGDAVLTGNDLYDGKVVYP